MRDSAFADGGRSNAKEIDGVQIYAGLFQNVARIGFRSPILDQEINAFDSREVANDFCVGPGNGGEFAGPIGFFVGPAEPGGFVMFPLCGHPETTFKGSGTARG